MSRPMEISAATLRSLARGLLYERGGEDALQDAWLAALRKDVPAEGLARFLGVAAYYSASLRRRADSRRRARERGAARPEALPSAADNAARVELLRRVVEAVDALGEPYKGVVLLRYFEDLPPRAIARRLGVPVNTVRTHLRRAHERLRRQLDDERGREELLAALAVLAGPAPLALAPVIAAGVAATAAAATAVAWLALRGPGAAPRGDARVAGGTAETERADAPSSSAASVRAAEEDGGGRAGLAAAWTVRGHVSRGVAGAFPRAPLRGIVRAGYASDGATLLEETFESDDSGDFAWTIEPPSADATIVVESLASGHLATAAAELLAHGDPAPERMLVTAWPFDAEVVGEVRDAGGALVPGAALALGPQQRATSDAEGRYRLLVSSQQDELTLSALLAGRGAAEIDLAPLRAGEARRLDVALGPERIVTGTVHDETGAPVEGARVRLLGPDASATTDASGRYELRCAASASWGEAWAEKAGYARTRENRTWRRNGGAATLDLVLSRGAIVRGRVVDEAGRAIEGARIGSTRSDAAGAFELARLAPEMCRFEVTKRGHARALLEIDPTPPRVAPGHVEVFLQPAARVSGRVVDAEDRPVAWARVRAGGRATCTDVEGLFELDDVAPDAPRVEASAPGLVTLELPLAGELEGLVVRLEPRARLAGRVLDGASGAPITSFVLRITDPADPRSELPRVPWTWSEGVALASADGAFSLGGDFGAGLRARIAIEAEGYAPAVVLAEAALEPSPDGCVARLARATRVSGRVVEAATGAPVPRARVRRAGNALGAPVFEGSAEATTDEDGRFELLGLPTGTTYLAVHTQLAASAVDGPFELGAETVERRIELAAGASVSGRLLDAGGAARANETVFLRGDGAFGEPYYWSTQTDVDGRFEFRALPPGAFALGHALRGWIPPPPGAQAPSELADIGYARAGSTPVEAGDLVERIELAADSALERELRPGGAARLRGTLASAQPLPELVAVSLVRLDDAGAPTGRERGALARDGAFEIAPLEPGTYEARVAPCFGDRGLFGSARVEVPEAGEASVHVDLERR